MTTSGQNQMAWMQDISCIATPHTTLSSHLLYFSSNRKKEQKKTKWVKYGHLSRFSYSLHDDVMTMMAFHLFHWPFIFSVIPMQVTIMQFDGEGSGRLLAKERKRLSLKEIFLIFTVMIRPSTCTFFPAVILYLPLLLSFLR